MSAWLRRTLAFTRFTLQEYVRSGRVLVEVAALIVVLWLFFWPRGEGGLDSRQFFNLSGIFVLALAIYTTAVMMGLGGRPQGYVMLARPLGRRGYLIGLYLAAVALVSGIFVVLSLSVVFINPPTELTLKAWSMGALPLMLDIMVLASFTTLVAPLVLSPGMRLLVLGLLAVALSTDIETIGSLEVDRVLQPLQTLLSLPLLPAMSGFELAVQRNYDSTAVTILLGQGALMAALLAFALSAFERRELILSS